MQVMLAACNVFRLLAGYMPTLPWVPFALGQPMNSDGTSVILLDGKALLWLAHQTPHEKPDRFMHRRMVARAVPGYSF